MTLTDYVRRIVQRWRVIAVTVGVLLALATGLTLSTTPTYESTSRVFISNSGDIKDLGTQVAAGVYAQQKVLSYAAVASSATMASTVINDLGLTMDPEDLASEITTSVEFGTVLVTIVVQDPSAARATEINQSIIRNYNAVIDRVDVARGQESPVLVSTMETPRQPTSPSSPNLGLNLIAALFAGLLIGVALAALRDLLDDTIKSAADLSQAGISSLGQVPMRPIRRGQSSQQQDALVSHLEQTPTAEAMRQLRINLQFASLDQQPKTLLVTSSGPEEGKSFVSANLAAVMSATGQSVVLVDLDLRRPVLAARLGLERMVGVTSVLLGRATLAESLQSVPGTGIALLAAGPLPPNPAEVLSTQAVADLVKDLAGQFDVVVLDTPPAGLFVDARQIATYVDGVIVVARHKKSKRSLLLESVASLKDVGANVLGVVINRTPVQSRSEYAQYSYAVRPGRDEPRRSRPTRRRGSKIST